MKFLITLKFYTIFLNQIGHNPSPPSSTEFFLQRFEANSWYIQKFASAILK